VNCGGNGWLHGCAWLCANLRSEFPATSGDVLAGIPAEWHKSDGQNELNL